MAKLHVVYYYSDKKTRPENIMRTSEHGMVGDSMISGWFMITKQNTSSDLSASLLCIVFSCYITIIFHYYLTLKGYYTEMEMYAKLIPLGSAYV